jgi:hypothetical protein
MTKLKAKFRAWLLEIVREGVKTELEIEWAVRQRIERGNVRGGIPGLAGTDIPMGVGTLPKPIAQPPPPEPSFEQLQDESIAEQEKHYAEQRV